MSGPTGETPMADSMVTGSGMKKFTSGPGAREPGLHDTSYSSPRGLYLLKVPSPQHHHMEDPALKHEPSGPRYLQTIAGKKGNEPNVFQHRHGPGKAFVCAQWDVISH